MQKYKKKSTEKTMDEAIANINAKKINEWARFIELSQEQKNTRNGDKGVAIYLDSDIKKKLEMLKLSGLDYPVRYMLNAAMKVFFEANEEKIQEQLSNLSNN